MRLNENNDLFPDKNQNQNENTRADVLDQSVHRIKHTGMYRHTVNIPTRVGVGNKYINETREVQWVYIYTGAVLINFSQSLITLIFLSTLGNVISSI